MTTEQSKSGESEVNIALDYSDIRTVGYVTPWPTDATTFDGWLMRDDEPTDEMVVNGASEMWARYRVLRAYMQKTLDLIDETGGDPNSLFPVIASNGTDNLAATADAINLALWNDYQAQRGS